MPRRQRRAGVKYIKDDREREITFYKRRSGIFKVAADLAALTGASAAVVLETSNGRMHAFGTPSADPIIDSFLSGRPPAAPFASEATRAKMRRMQNDLVRLDDSKVEDDKRASLSTSRADEVLDEAPAVVARRVFGKVEELVDLDEVTQHLLELTTVHQAICRRLPPSLRRRCQDEISDQSTQPPPPPPAPPQWSLLPQQHLQEEIGRRSMPPPPPPPSQWPSPAQAENTPPPSQGFSSTLAQPPLIPPLQPSWSHLFPLRPPSSLSSFPHLLMTPWPHLPRSPAPPQAPPLPQPYPFIRHRHSFGTETISNGAPPVPMHRSFPPPAMSLATFLPPLPNPLPQVPPSQKLRVNNPVETPQNYEDPNPAFHVEVELSPPVLGHAGGDAIPEDDDPFADGQWAADLVDEHDYSNLLGLSAELLGSDDNGGEMNQLVGGGDQLDMFAATDLPTEDGWVDMMLELES